MNIPKNLLVAILVVEDEALIRLGTVSHLEDEGYKVYQTHSADDAIQILENHAEIRLIFTDINMPGSMDGLKLAHYVRGRWPPVKIIVTSGKMDHEMPAGAFFLGKPYRLETIAARMRMMLAEAA
jgi:CheY-like chemotaxis protein